MRQAKRWLGLLLSLVMLVALLSIIALPASAETYSGECGADGSNLTWTLDTTTGVLKITGTGEMENWKWAYTSPWFSYKDSIKSIVIGSGVTSIGSNAFLACWGVPSVTIPGSVTSIGAEAFSWCISLTSVTIPGSVTSIGAEAFDGCDSLKSVTIPDSVTSIGSEAFAGCDELTSVTIGSGVTSIGDHAFHDTAYAKNASNWTGDILYIGNYLIEAKETLKGACTIKGGTKLIADSAFSGRTGLTSVTIGSGLTIIGYQAFSDCTGLTSVTIPDGVMSIGDNAFRGCTGLTSVTIPGSVTSIGDDAFSGCTGLTSVTIPDSVTNIGDYAFYNCTGLTSITIADSVTSVGSSAFSGTGFYKDASNWTGDVLYVGNYLIEAQYSIWGAYTIKDGTKAIADNAFWLCEGLMHVTLPDSVTSIGEDAFLNCKALTKVTIPYGVTSIGYRAFYGCSELKSITIPESVTSIGEKALGYYLDFCNADGEVQGPGFTIYGYADSAAQTYAEENGFTFVVLGNDPVGPGDVDGSGEVDAIDSIRLAKYLVELVELTDAQKQAADVDGDGDVAATDAIRLAKFLVGLIETLKSAPAKAATR